MGVSPIPFIFAQLWFLCAAVRPSIDEEDLGHRASLLLESNEVSECPEEVQEKLRGQLQGLGLSGEGDPCFWNGMGCLHCKVLRIWSKEASGDLSSIKEMTKLRDLRLAGSRITGNVSELSKLKDLVRLHLSQTEVMGDLAELSKLTALEDLRLPHTQVSGNVAKLSKLKELWHLDLAQTEVMGDLAELSKLTALKYLHLPHTQVVGDVSMLSNMTGLRDLSLAQSRVHGNFGVISSMPNLVKADLSSTAVSGNLGDLESDCCKKLRELHLGDTQVRISGRDLVSLPVLQSLNVSGCNLNVSFIDLFYRLHVNPITILLARGCGITGEVKSPWFLPSLWRSLQLFDLSGNRLDAVHALPAKLRLDVSHNEIPLRVSRDVIKSAAKSGTDLWMMNTELANREEIMSNCSNELQMEEMWISRETGGYWCHDLIQPNFRVTPERFLPQLMCACGPGHFGAGTNCSACPEDTFNDQMDQRKCQACPEGGKAPAGSQALSACKCPYGTPGKFENETMCLCERNEALSHAQKCVSCTENNVLCSSGADRLATAPLKDGYIRLKEPSEEIFECLDPQHCRNSSCAPGRAGALCASCAQDYRSSKKVCVECKNVSSEKRLSIGLGCATALLILAATAWRLRHHLPQPSPRAECLLQLIIAQLAVLLQLTQLWTVLGDLAPAVETAANVAPVDDSAQGDPLLGYLEALQFTSSELQNFLALQCVYDGVTVRSLFALATPLVPLLLLIACGCGEVFSRGLGIRIGLKTLTVLFIGGASGSAQLLGCQRTDGAGAALKEFAFRPLFPHERCDEALWVDRIGWATAICYGLVIPCFLGFLFAKQNVVMRKVKTAVMQTARNEGKVIVRLQGLESEQSFKDATLSKRLLAGAAACVAVDGKGRALVEVQNDAVIVTPTTNISRASEDLGVESLVFGADVKEAEVLQRHVMAQMLMERSILEQKTDRVMLGAKELFCKYAKCENVWMEVCTKVASAALVSVVAVDNLWLCVTITLGMALVIGLAQPFAQPQINVLQSACFGCLALAAVGFRHHTALARLALAVPFVLLVLQLRRPDSPEMLALRLQQELEAKIHEGPVEVSSEQFT